MQQDQESDAIDAIYEALDRGDPGEALSRASQALAGAERDPVLHFLAGRALLELDRPDEAAGELGLAVELDADDGEFRAYLAWALFRAGRFAEADPQIEQALLADDRLAEAHHVRGLLLERRGRLVEADRCFKRSADLAPDWFFAPRRFSDAEFRRQLDIARAALREEFRTHLDRVTVLVEDLPSDATLFEEQPPLDAEQLLGLFCGVSLDGLGGSSAGGDLPPRIYLFKRNLERCASDPEELAEQIRVTLYHELGHYLGMDEDQLDDSGYG